MKVPTFLVVALVPLFPQSIIHAQVKAADLAGTWVGGLSDSTGTTAKTTSDTLIMESNGQFRWADSIWAIASNPRRGHVASDTVLFDSGPYNGGPNYQLTLKDQQLLINIDRTVVEKYVKALGDSGTAGGGRFIRSEIFSDLLARAKPVPQNQLRVVYAFRRVASSTSKP
jgi:hypothetical protein